MDNFDITIIGAGVVGLSIAQELSKIRKNIVVLEAEEKFGQGVSSRNSEVIHSGIYYPENTLKARLCVRGAELLYELCSRNSIPHRKLGKLIVAVDDSEIEAIELLFKKAKINKVKEVKILKKNEITRMEPQVRGLAAVYLPGTGIINSHALMDFFYSRAKAQDVIFAFSSKVNMLRQENDGYVVGIENDDYKFKSRLLINCAGLNSERIAAMLGIDTKANQYQLKYCKGSYFSYSGNSPVDMLVYPVPCDELTGLGVHATLDLAGRLRFGPDVEYVDSVDYNVDVSKAGLFYEGASKLIPGLKRDKFTPDMAGIRPKLYGKCEKVRDFIINEESGKGLPGLVNLIGIESPGLTACCAIAEYVKDLVSNFS